MDRFNELIFRLDKKDINDLAISQFVTSRNNLFKGQSGGTRKFPYAFTEQGIYMLMTVLRSKLAVEQS